MPLPGKRWRHIVINTKGTWLHGDERGFRNRDHRIHSSGDYRKPPPKGEHKNLHAYMKKRSTGEVTIDRDLRPIIGRAIIEYLREIKVPLLSVSVGKIHAHFHVELDDDVRQIKRVVGHVKRKSSRAVKDLLPGAVWSAGETYEPIDNPHHQEATYDYILYKQKGSWTWSYRDGSLEGVFNRKKEKTKNPGRRCAMPRRGG